MADGSGSASADQVWLQRCIELARTCPPGSTFSVGAVLVGPDGSELASGCSRATGPAVHAEESALAQFAGDRVPPGSTMYSTLEPCGRRLSGAVPCAQRILAAGVSRVVYVLDEPPTFVDGTGAEQLRAGGVEVVLLPALQDVVRPITMRDLGG